VEGNAYPGGSFPSSHIAAAVVALACLPYLGRWAWPVLFLTLLMALGTLYGRYHYFVDVLAGLAVGLACLYLGPWLERKWPLVFDEEGIVRERREAVDRG
jgi:membrane-associated phospholipid phosphatase